MARMNITAEVGDARQLQKALIAAHGAVRIAEAKDAHPSRL
jgi:hypothetical protein